MIGRVFVVNDVLPTTPLLGYTPGRTTIDSSSVWGPGFRCRVPSCARPLSFGGRLLWLGGCLDDELCDAASANLKFSNN